MEPEDLAKINGRLRRWEGNFQETSGLDMEVYAREIERRYQEKAMATLIGSAITSPFSHGVIGPAQSQMGQAMGQANVKPDPHNPHLLTGMINSRMRAAPGDFDYMLAHYLGNECYVVFVIHKGQYAAIEDGAMFPSDNLITKLRLMAD